MAEISIWIEDIFECRDFLGNMKISLLDIFKKGQMTEFNYIDKDSNTQYEKIKKFVGIKKGNMAIDDKLEFSLKYEIWFFPADIAKYDDLNLNFENTDKNDLTSYKLNEEILATHSLEIFANYYRKKLQYIERDDPKLFKIRFFGFKNYYNANKNDIQIHINKFLLTKKVKNLDNNFKAFYIKDQFGNYRILNSFLSKLTIETSANEYTCELFDFQDRLGLDKNKITQKIDNNNTKPENKSRKLKTIESILQDERNVIEKIKLGIGNTVKGYLHFVSCIKFSKLEFEDNQFFIHSPDYVLKNRKGTVYEHAILLACLLINFYNKKEIKIIDFENETPDGNLESGLDENNLDAVYEAQNNFQSKKFAGKNSLYSDLKNQSQEIYEGGNIRSLSDDRRKNILKTTSNGKEDPYIGGADNGSCRKIYNDSEASQVTNPKINSKSPLKTNVSDNSLLSRSNVIDSYNQKEIEMKELTDKDKNQNKAKKNFRKEKIYHYTRRELEIIRKYKIQKPDLALIEKKIKIDGVKFIILKFE